MYKTYFKTCNNILFKGLLEEKLSFLFIKNHYVQIPDFSSDLRISVVTCGVKIIKL